MELLNETADVARQERAGDEPYLKEAGRTLALRAAAGAARVGGAVGGDGGQHQRAARAVARGRSGLLSEDESDRWSCR
jgi:hypothetical protein